MKSTRYEWDVETTDEHGDIQDHDHDYSLRELLRRHNPMGANETLALVRDVFEDDDLKDRSWAYVQNGAMDDFFRGGPSSPVKVPVRFKEEFFRETYNASKPNA